MHADKPICFEYIKFYGFCNKLFCIGTILCVVACFVYPIFDSIFLAKQKVLCFGFLIPYTDPQELVGYALNFLFQIWQVIVLCFGYVAFLRMYFLLFVHACLRSDILKINMEDFNGHITEFDDQIHQNEKLSIMLNEIVRQHLNYLKLINSFLLLKF